MKIKSILVCSTVLYSVALFAGPAYSENMSITRIATMPAGAEVTGLSTNALGELFFKRPTSRRQQLF